MRTLTSTLATAQQAKSKKPCPKIVLTSGATSYTYSTERILRLEHGYTDNSHKATVILSNADKALTDIDLKGFDAVISDCLVTTAGDEYSATPPRKVLGQTFESYQGVLSCTLELIGIPDRLKEDKSSGDYQHHWSSTKTVKDLITEIADGQPVTETLTDSQEEYDGYWQVGGSTRIGVGQKCYICNEDGSARTVSSISFYLKKIGSPTGDITFHITYVDDEGDACSKVWGDASTLSTSPAWCKATLTTPVEIDPDRQVYIWCEWENYSSGNTVWAGYNSEDIADGEWLCKFNSSGDPYIFDYDTYDLAYKYEFASDGIDVFDHCVSYDVEYDSEDSLIDSYCPADSFSIKQGDNRLAKIDGLLYHTNCQYKIGSDGKIHIFMPTTTGTTYDYQYQLSSGHPFFSKALRHGMVIPSKITVESNPDDEDQYSGSATSAASYALLPTEDFYRTTLTSNTQAAAIAAAIISRLEINTQQGGASVPVNCGAELYDYVKVTDERESDYRVGNLGSLTTIYKAGTRSSSPEYYTRFSFGKISLKGVPGTKTHSLKSSGVITRANDGSIPPEDLFALLDEITQNIQELNAYKGWLDSQTSAKDQINKLLKDYYTKTQVESGFDFENHSVTSSRAVDTVYQNSYGHPITVKVNCSVSDGDWVTAYCEENDDTPDVVVDSFLNNTGSTLRYSLTFKVPIDGYYKVTQTSGTITIVSWIETEEGIGA